MQFIRNCIKCACERCTTAETWGESICLWVNYETHKQKKPAAAFYLTVRDPSCWAMRAQMIRNTSSICHQLVSTGSQSAHWLDTTRGAPLGEAKHVVDGPNPIMHRSSRWMIKQAEGRSGQSAHSHPFQISVMQTKHHEYIKELYENDAWGVNMVGCKLYK